MSRKKKILEAALTLFAENGYSGTPTSAVAKKAGVAEGLIFHHFKNKKGILRHIFQTTLEEYKAQAAAAVISAHTGLDGVEQYIRFHFDFAAKWSRQAVILARDVPPGIFQADREFNDYLTRVLAESLDQIADCITKGQADGSVRDLPAWDTAYMIRGILDGTTKIQLAVPACQPGEDLLENMVAFCRKALCS